MKLRVILEQSEEGGYTAYVPGLPCCISGGNTKDETLRNIKEAIELNLESVENDMGHGPSAEVMEDAGNTEIIFTISPKGNTESASPLGIPTCEL